MCNSENRLSETIGLRRLGAGFLLVVLLSGLATPPRAAAQQPQARNIVYVESDDPAGNAIFAFTRGQGGQLSPLPGSPFSTGGLGITPTFALGPFDSDQNLIVGTVGPHEFLFAVNGGSDTIAVFRDRSERALRSRPCRAHPFRRWGPTP